MPRKIVPLTTSEVAEPHQRSQASFIGAGTFTGTTSKGIRGAEAFDLLQALNTGHRGTLSTTHANSVIESLERLAICVTDVRRQPPTRTVRRHLGTGLQLPVAPRRLQRPPDRHRTRRVNGYDREDDQCDLETLYGA